MSERLTDEQVRAIRHLRAAGVQETAIARRYGITQGLVSQYVTGQRRQNAGGPIQKPRKYEKKKR